MNSYPAGNMVRLTATFTNSAGAAVDPSSVHLLYAIVKPIASSVSSLAYGVNSIVKLSTGVYYHDVDASSAGDWRYRWVARGSNAAAAEGGFSVPAPLVGPA